MLQPAWAFLVLFRDVNISRECVGSVDASTGSALCHLLLDILLPLVFANLRAMHGGAYGLH